MTPITRSRSASASTIRASMEWSSLGRRSSRAFCSSSGISLDLLVRRDRDGIEEGHHGAKLRADLLDRLLLFRRAGRDERRAALLVLVDPRLRKCPGLD